jgi:hypothetical protein
VAITAALPEQKDQPTGQSTEDFSVCVVARRIAFIIGTRRSRIFPAMNECAQGNAA